MFSRKVSRLSNRDGQSTDCAGNSAVEGGQANRKGGQEEAQRKLFFPPPSVAEDRIPSELFWKMCSGKGENVESKPVENLWHFTKGKGWWLMDVPPQRKEKTCSLSL